MFVIYRYLLLRGEQVLELPADAIVLTMQVENGDYLMYVRMKSHEPTKILLENRVFCVERYGVELDDEIREYDFKAAINGWCLFEVITPQPKDVDNG